MGTATADSTSSKIDRQEDNVTREDDAQVDKNKRAEETSQTIVDAEKSPNAEVGSVKSPEEQKYADVESRFVDEAQRMSEQSKMEGENESKHETEATAEMTSTEINPNIQIEKSEKEMKDEEIAAFYEQNALSLSETFE